MQVGPRLVTCTIFFQLLSYFVDFILLYRLYSYAKMVYTQLHSSEQQITRTEMNNITGHAPGRGLAQRRLMRRTVTIAEPAVARSFAASMTLDAAVAVAKIGTRNISASSFRALLSPFYNPFYMALQKWFKKGRPFGVLSLL